MLGEDCDQGEDLLCEVLTLDLHRGTISASEHILFSNTIQLKITFQAVYEVGSVPGCSPYIRLVSGVGGD